MNNKKENILDLYEISVKIGKDGVKSRLSKYRAKFTGQNYLPVRLTEEEEKSGYVGCFSQRIKNSEILKVQRIGLSDSSDHISRYIYFLDNQKEQAINLIKEELDKTISKMFSDINELYKVWVNRHEAKE